MSLPKNHPHTVTQVQISLIDIIDIISVTFVTEPHRVIKLKFKLDNHVCGGKKQTWQLTTEYGLPNFQHVSLVNQEAELYLKCFDTKFMTPKFTESTLPFPNKNYVRLQG